MKATRQLVGMMMLCPGLVLAQGVNSATTASEVPAATKPAAATEPDPSLVGKLRNDARGSVSVQGETATRAASFITVGRNGDLLPRSDSRAVDKAAAFLDEYGALLGATDPAQLKETSRRTDEYGTTVTYVQAYRGVPVFGGTILAHLDTDGDLTAVNGTAVPDINLSTAPRLSTQQIATRAVAYVKSDPPTGDDDKPAQTNGLRAVSTQLMVYRTGLVRGESGTSYLAYRVEVTNRANIRDIVFMHAGNGKVLNRYSMINTNLKRKLYEKHYKRAALVWEEGDPFPGSLNANQRRIILGSGESYHFFKNAFGRDSYNNKGHVMRTVNNDPSIACPNANWNGTTTNYCNGVTADDVVAHEWGHAYTQFTHNLVYQFQPGALNESYSDIWGETVDMLNGRQTDSHGGTANGAKRADGACSTHTSALPVVVIRTPASIAKTCPAGGASFGRQLGSMGVRDKVVQAKDVAEPEDPTNFLPAGTTKDGCSPILNRRAVSGKIALIDRGRCAFIEKVKNAQDAGARAVIIGNNVPGAPFFMSDTDPTIHIPSVMISKENRNLIVGKLKLGKVVRVTLKKSPRQRDNSYRWLIGEDAKAFGGAIRDMWTPNCLGDPGKVSDAQYHCDEGDGGGVHTNSAVPNHGYALLVDGGHYNGITVPKIGLTKAAHIYWRAQAAYQTPTTDFADHADSLKSACLDLAGHRLRALSTDKGDSHRSSAVITATNCTSVDAMARAVQLRKEPTQCNFRPLLAKNAPNLCGGNRTRHTVWKETFSKGLTAWDRSEKWVFADQPYRWRPDSTLPGKRSGTAAFGVDPAGGSCNGDANDLSGVMRMRSKSIHIPGPMQKSPRLTFMHYIATEAGYDGGNVKVSVNGGPFGLVPASAYIYNEPRTLAGVADGNTNPLAGQDGFTGTDGGEVTGSWGQSQIDLTMIGVRPGDSIKIRIDMGLDGCGGVDGWYVDDITVSTCKAGTRVHATQSPRASRFGKAARVNVTVDALGGLGTPTGKVVVREHGRLLGTAKLDHGRVRMALPRFLGAGVHNVVVRYNGSKRYASSQDRLAVRVNKAVTTTLLTLTPKPVIQGRRLIANVGTATDSFQPRGLVLLRHNGHLIGRDFMKDGRARIVVDRLLPRGEQVFRAVYVGNGNILRSADSAVAHVIRR